MRMVSTAQFKTHANRFFKMVTSTKKPIVITRHGNPCAVIEPFTEEDIEALAFEYGQEVLSMAKESAADMKARRSLSMRDFAKKHGLA